MKNFYLALTLLSSLCLPLISQGDDKEIPTEISLPPYDVGDLVVEQGYYISRGEEQASINFRIVDNRLRLYWIDADGLVVEPEYSEAVVRFTGSVRGRAYHKLNPLPGGAGLGAAGIMVPPHLYNVILVFPTDGESEPESHAFRYTPALDVPVDASQ